MNSIKQQTSSKTTIDRYIGLESDLSTLIDTYKVRLAKIEKATNSIAEWNQEKAWKASAAKQTKRFISDLRRLQKLCRLYDVIEHEQAKEVCDHYYSAYMKKGETHYHPCEFCGKIKKPD